MKRITFEGNFCDICQCIGEPGNTSECESGFCDQRRTWERLKEYEDKIDRGELAEVVRCKDCKYYEMHYGRGNMGCSNQKAIWTQCPPDAFCSYGERRDEE